MDSNLVETKVTTVIEDIQEAVVLAGGKFFRQKEVRNMDVEELLRHLIPNHIVFGVEYVPETKPIKKVALAALMNEDDEE